MVISLLTGIGNTSSVSSSIGVASGSLGGTILGETGDLAGTTIPSEEISGTLVLIISSTGGGLCTGGVCTGGVCTGGVCIGGACAGGTA